MALLDVLRLYHADLCRIILGWPQQKTDYYKYKTALLGGFHWISISSPTAGTRRLIAGTDETLSYKTLLLHISCSDQFLFHNLLLATL